MGVWGKEKAQDVLQVGDSTSLQLENPLLPSPAVMKGSK